MLQRTKSKYFRWVGIDPPVQQVKMVTGFVYPKRPTIFFEAMPTAEIVGAMHPVEIPAEIHRLDVPDHPAQQQILDLRARRCVAIVEGDGDLLAARRLRVENFTAADGKRDNRAVADPAAPVTWARFYELGTNRPVFTGRDKVIRYDFNEIERERRTGYGYLGDWPANLLAKDYPRWRARNKLP